MCDLDDMNPPLVNTGLRVKAHKIILVKIHLLYLNLQLPTHSQVQQPQIKTYLLIQC